MRKITSFGDFCRRVKGRLTRPFKRLRRWTYKVSQERTFSTERDAAQVTYYYVGNLGDTVLSWCVRKTLDQLCGIKTYKIVEVNREVTEKTIDQINNSRLLVIGGGGLFLPDTNKNSISGWQWAVSREQLQKIKVPIILYTVGYNYFRGQTTSRLFEESLKAIISKSRFVGLRNTGSCVAVKEILGEGVYPDVVYQPCTTTLIRKIYKELPPKKQSGRIGVNIAFDREKLRFGTDETLILTQIAQAMKAIEDKGYKIYYVAHCTDDLRFLPYLRQAGVCYEEVCMGNWLPLRAIKFYNTIDCMFGMRGHAQMIPFGVNCEIISLGSHEKMRWFLEDVGGIDWYVELRQKPSTLRQRILDTFVRVHEQQPEETRKRLLAAQERLWNITKHNAETIRNILKN